MSTFLYQNLILCLCVFSFLTIFILSPPPPSSALQRP